MKLSENVRECVAMLRELGEELRPTPDMELIVVMWNILTAQIGVMEALALAMGNQSPMRISMGLRMKLIGWCATVREAVSKLVKETV